MAEISPLYGKVKICATGGSEAAILSVTKATWKEDASTFDSTSTDSGGYKSHLVGTAMKSATLDVECILDTTELKHVGAPPVISAGVGVDFEDILDNTNLPGTKFSGTGTITSREIGWDVNQSGALATSFTIQVSGAWTQAATWA